jgi:hypothetical protein
MAYDVTIECMRGVLRLEIRGTRFPDQAVAQARQLWSEIADECLARNTRLVLIVSHLSGPLSVLNAFDIGARMRTPDTGARPAVAYVNLDSDSLPESQFAVTVAQNRGWSIEAFGSEEDAWNWLAQRRDGDGEQVGGHAVEEPGGLPRPE